MERGTAVLDRLTFMARHLSRHSLVDHGILIFIPRSHWHMSNSFKLREMYGSTHQSWMSGKLMKMTNKSEAISISGGKHLEWDDSSSEFSILLLFLFFDLFINCTSCLYAVMESSSPVNGYKNGL